MGDGRFKPGHKKGVPKSKEHRERISLALKKHNANPEVREQKRLRMLGTLNPMAGKHFNHAMDVTKRKGWKGGISYEKEPKEFSKMLKKYIHAVGLGENELEEEFVFHHDIMSEEQLKSERRKLVNFFKAQEVVKNF